jgi:hypothetical protein
VYRLHGKHAFQYPNVPEHRKTTNSVRKHSMSIVVETDNPTLEPTRNQDIQRETPIAAGTYDGQPDALV